jgi:hypothetical protein
MAEDQAIADLERAREKLIKARRQTAKNIAMEAERDQVEFFTALQAALDATEKAIEQERKLLPGDPNFGRSRPKPQGTADADARSQSIHRSR